MSKLIDVKAGRDAEVKAEIGGDVVMGGEADERRASKVSGKIGGINISITALLAWAKVLWDKLLVLLGF